MSVLFSREFLSKSGSTDYIRKQLAGLDVSNVEELQKVGGSIRSRILSSSFPSNLEEAIREGYLALSGGAALPVAVRSSATTEDMADASFAGQQDTYLNVVGEEKVLDCTKKCIASLFTDRAISYRAKMGFDHIDVGLSVGIQKMVNSEAAGVMFTIDPDSGNENFIVIDSSWGLGESVVSGKVNPDKFFIYKKTGEIVGRRLGQKEVFAKYNSTGTEFVNTPLKRRAQFSLTREQIKVLVEYARKIENHYAKRMDIEWAVEGGKVYILQARPETVQSSKGTLEETYHLKGEGKLLVAGIAVGGKIGQGKPNVMADVS